LRKRGQAVPDEFDEPPQIHDDLIPIWAAYYDLGASRQSGMSPVGIPWVEMSTYCEDHGISGGAKLRWIRLLRALDQTFLRHYAKESKARRRRKESEHGNA